MADEGVSREKMTLDQVMHSTLLMPDQRGQKQSQN